MSDDMQHNPHHNQASLPSGPCGFQHPKPCLGRAVTLEQEFTSTRMEDLPHASAYCQRLKSLADQLKNVGAPISNNRLVLQLVLGLSEAYKSVGTQIRHAKPLPTFNEARSSICQEERELAAIAAQGSGTAMLVSVDDTQPESSTPNHGRNNNSQRNNSGRKGSTQGKQCDKGGNVGAHRSGSSQAPWQGQQPGHWQWVPYPTTPHPYPTSA